MTTNTNFAELSEWALKIDPGFAAPHGKEVPNAYAGRLLNLFNGISDDRDADADAPVVWSELPEGVQEWLNEAASAQKAQKPLPEIEGLVGAAVPKAAVKRGATKTEPAPAPASEPAPKLTASERMKALNEKRRTEKAAAAGGTPVETAEPATSTQKAAAAVKEAKAAKAPKRTGDSACQAAQRFLVHNWNATIDQMREHLVSVGHPKVSDATLKTVRGHAIPTLKIAREEGLLK